MLVCLFTRCRPQEILEATRPKVYAMGANGRDADTPTPAPNGRISDGGPSSGQTSVTGMASGTGNGVVAAALPPSCALFEVSLLLAANHSDLLNEPPPSHFQVRGPPHAWDIHPGQRIGLGAAAVLEHMAR